MVNESPKSDYIDAEVFEGELPKGTKYARNRDQVADAAGDAVISFADAAEGVKDATISSARAVLDLSKASWATGKAALGGLRGVGKHTKDFGAAFKDDKAA